jgi:diacylglycerol kinase family enzyme
MIDYPHAELTSVPYGNANDFVRAFGEDAAPYFRDIKALTVAPSFPLDVIYSGFNYALCSMNIGLVGQTVIHANNILRHATSKWIRPFTSHVYSFSGVLSLANGEVMRQDYSVKLDENDFSGRYVNIHIANVATDGGSFVSNPYAKPNDGILDVIMMGSSSRMGVVRIIDDRNKGTFEKHKVFKYHQCRKLVVQSELPLCVQMDGEGMYAQEVKLEILPGRIKIFAPESVSLADFSHLAYKKKNDKVEKEI